MTGPRLRPGGRTGDGRRQDVGTPLLDGHRPIAEGAHVHIPLGDPRPPFTDMVQMIRQIELGHMITLFPRSFAERHTRPGLVWRTVDDAPDARFAVAWPAGSHSRAVATFVRVAVAVAAKRHSVTVSAAS